MASVEEKIPSLRRGGGAVFQHFSSLLACFLEFAVFEGYVPFAVTVASWLCSCVGGRVSPLPSALSPLAGTRLFLVSASLFPFVVIKFTSLLRFRFHRQVISHSVCLSLSDLLH